MDIRESLTDNGSDIRAGPESPLCLAQKASPSKRFLPGLTSQVSTREKMTTINAATLAEIREANLSYLLLAQRLLHEDRVAAMYRLGLSEQVAQVLGSFTLAQAVKVASSSHLLCRSSSSTRN